MIRANAVRSDYGWSLVHQLAATAKLLSEMVSIVQEDTRRVGGSKALANEELQGPLGRSMEPPDQWPALTWMKPALEEWEAGLFAPQT